MKNNLSKYYTHNGQFLRTPIKLIGGKTKVRDRIYPLFPKHNVYIEPFGGSMSIIMGKEPVPYELANDINEDIICLFWYLQNEPDELYFRINEHLKILFEKEKEYFIELRNNLPARLTIERAAVIYVISKAAMNGILRYNKEGKCNSSYCNTVKGRGWITKEWLDLVTRRINHVVFTNKDYLELLYTDEIFPDRSETFVFLDPPYRLADKNYKDGSVTVYNGKKFTQENHEELAYALENVSTKTNWLMTINDCTWTRWRYRDFFISDNVVNYSCSQTASGRGDHNELLISNYDIHTIKKDLICQTNSLKDN